MLKNIKSWYLQKFKDTTREEYDVRELDKDMSNIGIAVKMRLLDRIKFVFTGKYNYRLKNVEVYFIKNYHAR
jgi:hypothetical protein